MIPVGLLLKAPAVIKVLGAVRAHWQWVGIGLAAIALCGLLWGLGAASANRRWEAKHARAVADWNAAVARAAEETARAEAEARRIETAWRDHVAKREKEFKDATAANDARIAKLSVAGDRLRGAVDHFVKASSAPRDPGAACPDYGPRLETLGVLVTERDRMAGTCEAEADRLGDLVRLCRGYGEAIGR